MARRRVSVFTRIVFGSLALLAVLLGIGLSTREAPGDKPYMVVAGSGFMFNYRIAEATYGFTAELQRPVKAFSRIVAQFEDPAGGPPIVVAQTLYPRTTRYGIQTPPVTGVERGKPYRVSVRLLQNGDDAVLFEKEFTVASQLPSTVIPPAPLTIGPGYRRNPALPDGWKGTGASQGSG
ncbi:hypothetical protein [Aurantimonas sp. Leaf443]|uniref:hypothetical protein n=1 Tax=Aurantimonas sp. Leaf443 TaxID=1736378 RepID=UPI0006F51057|nr:hypothetical protein [Aurantimonas sp. Leaf443]KQT82527.1 hypothetical protein ASG48_15785 [Aurantimonas sp. Leaf443]